MELTINEILEGKATIIKNKEFFPTRQYVEPFLEKMSKFTDKFTVQAKMPDQMTKNGTIDATFNRVLIQAVLPSEYQIDNHNEVIGFLYGLDVKKPVCKIYRGYENMACTNLSVFNPMWQQVQEIIPGDPINFSPLKHIMSLTNDFPVKIEKMKNTYLEGSPQDRQYNLGRWVDFTLRNSIDEGFGKVKLATSTAIDAYKQLYTEADSPYYYPAGMDVSLFDVYNSFTQVITDDKKDLMNKFSKTILISNLLGV